MPIAACESRTTLLIMLIMFADILTVAVRHTVRHPSAANVPVTFRTRRRRRILLRARRFVIGALVIVEQRSLGVRVPATARRRAAVQGVGDCLRGRRAALRTPRVRPAARVAVVFGGVLG